MHDHRAKLEWARKHFEELNGEINRFLARDDPPYKVAVSYEPERREHAVLFTDVADPPSDWSLRLGDSVHNLRSALDAITYALSVKHLGRAPTGSEVKLIQFVIVDDVKQWPGEAGKRLSHVGAAARDIINRFQPYHQ